MAYMIKILLFLLCLVALNTAHGLSPKAKIAILGASGYTGAELMRLLTVHPHTEIKVLTSTERNSGKDFGSIYPQFSYRKDIPALTLWEDTKKEIEDCDIAFCCLPHGTTQEIISELCSNKQSKVRVGI